MNLHRHDATRHDATRSAASRQDTGMVEPGLEDLLRHAVAIGAVIVLLLPAARGFSDTLGWLPLWLLAMPLSAWWALHRLRRSGHEPAAAPQPRMRRRSGEQARRRRPASPHRKHSQAA